MKKITVPDGLTRAVSQQVLKGRKNAPQILFVAGIAGFVGTTILASRATLKVDRVLDEHETEMLKIELAKTHPSNAYSDADARADKVATYTRTTLDVAKLYAPAVLVGTASIVCLSKSHSILSKRNAALGAAYAALDTGFRQYRERVRSEVGDQREYELYTDSRKEILALDEAETQLDELEGVIKPPTYSIYSRWFAQGRTFSWEPIHEANMTFLRATQVYMNQKLKMKGHMFLNEVYDALGLERNPAGAVVGWIYDDPEGDGYIDFGCWGFNDPNGGGVHIDPQTGKSAILLDFNVDGVIWNKI